MRHVVPPSSMPNAQSVARVAFANRHVASVALAASMAAGACARPATSGAPAPDRGRFDVVIENGRIVDGTGNPWTYGDVGIRGDRIVAVTQRGALRNASARQRLDARG